MTATMMMMMTTKGRDDVMTNAGRDARGLASSNKSIVEIPTEGTHGFL